MSAGLTRFLGFGVSRRVHPVWWALALGTVSAFGLEAPPFPAVEITIRVPGEIEDPSAREFWACVSGSGDVIWSPAFADDDGTWKVRFAPPAAGEYRVRACEEKDGVRWPVAGVDIQPETFTVSGDPLPRGYVRLSASNPRFFSRSPARSWYPVGMNVGWDTEASGPVESVLERLAAAGGNWARIWMCHWDGKNPDWVQGKRTDPGGFDPEVARRWDRIVATCEREGIAFQMVLFHHGAFSTRVNPNWAEHPWNVANGGFLERAEDFFTDARAREFTRRKLRAIVARYGHSPAVMAWELFNEVEFTDAARTPEGRAAIRAWHEEMAAWIRSVDPQRRLITTSAPGAEDPVWLTADFMQMHAYPPDPMVAAGGGEVIPGAWARPAFYGEIGPADPSGARRDDGGRVLHDVLWASLFSGAAGAAQYWAWDHVVQEALFPILASAAGFARRADLGNGRWRPLRATAWTASKADLVFGPGQRWTPVVDVPRELIPGEATRPWGTGWSATLRPRRGSGEAEGTDRATFRVRTREPVEGALVIAEVSAEGAKLEITADGHPVAVREWAAVQGDRPDRLPESIPFHLPAGTDQVSLRSTGADYFRMQSLCLKNFTTRFGVRAITDTARVAAWIYPEGSSSCPEGGWVEMKGLPDGSWQGAWWHTMRPERAGDVSVRVTGGRAHIAVPVPGEGLALLLEKQEDHP